MRDAANKIAELGGSKDLDSGRDITVEDAKKRAQQMKSALEVLDITFSRESQTSKLLFNIRHWTLMLGFISLAGSKLIAIFNA